MSIDDSQLRATLKTLSTEVLKTLYHEAVRKGDETFVQFGIENIQTLLRTMMANPEARCITLQKPTQHMRIDEVMYFLGEELRSRVDHSQIEGAGV